MNGKIVTVTVFELNGSLTPEPVSVDGSYEASR